jgi:hypothetical protein
VHQQLLTTTLVALVLQLLYLAVQLLMELVDEAAIQVLPMVQQILVMAVIVGQQTQIAAQAVQV